ncbi:MAG TPA: pitrilysin family protein [Thermoanaerobaculia bacterium]|nr:pitrilysin family protein [Thermoanaerobaculia bacterium]
MKPRLAIAALALISAFGPSAPAAEPSAPARAPIPVDYRKLPNGLKVVLSPDHTSPTAVVAVYYNIGFRIEPRDRTGFAHLFEHLMFQGSKNLGKMEFIKLVQSNGGVLNGSTRFDFTNYFEVVPANALRTALWAEADRMRGLAITQENLVNQQGVVKNEVKVNVLNRPYGGFPWLDMPQVANANWYNAHNFYGDLKDLDAATLKDAEAFFKSFYSPGNAALVVTGDFEPGTVFKWIQEYFGTIPSAPHQELPDISEPLQEKEKRTSKQDAQAPRPALAVAYHAPKRNTPEYYALGLIEQILAGGNDSRLYEALVRKSGLTGEVNSSINGLGNMFNIAGPTLFTVSLFHDREKTPDAILKVLDAEIEKIRTAPVDQATLDRAMVKMRSDLYAMQESIFGFGRADLLASFALFDDDPARINGLEKEFAKVTPELIRRTAQQYLRPTNRTILAIEPKPETPKLPGPKV